MELCYFAFGFGGDVYWILGKYESLTFKKDESNLKLDVINRPEIGEKGEFL